MFLHRGRGVPDCYRAGQAIIKEAVNGILVLYFLPPPMDVVPKPPLPLTVPLPTPEEEEEESEAESSDTHSLNDSDEVSSDFGGTGNMFANLGGRGGHRKPGGKKCRRHGGGRR
eukprot:TRINITY_DN25047_c0_g1_i1.p1 TRINITY_DN25047_c0_g1~~TRINITY_DN25047_c0_g1_i1.p1  ORF type:complete len:114 (+),score=26.97 TRINITY_DN25047_c0_g1_i1:3-344(+)